MVIAASVPHDLSQGVLRNLVGDMRVSVAIWTSVAVAAYVLLGASSTADANVVIPIWTAYFTNAWKLVLYIALINLPVNLFLYALFLAPVYARSREAAARAPASMSRLYANILLAVVAITVAGAAIDFFAFYEKTMNTWSGTEVYVLRDPASLSITVAVLPVFFSIVLCYAMITRLTWRTSLLPAAGMSVLNVFWWYFSIHALDELSFLPTFFSFAVLPIPFYFLRRWHTSRFGTGTVEAPSIHNAASAPRGEEQVGPSDATAPQAASDERAPK